jgi:hypothetical protein
MSTAASTYPLWGQAWELTVTAATASGSETTTISSSAWEPEALRITFDVLQAMNTAPLWYADISVYNLDSKSEQNILLNATWATLKAGFQFGPNISAIIWDGPVFQTILTREDVVDQRIILHCVALPGPLGEVVSFSMGQFSDQQQLLARIAQGINLPPMTTAQGTVGPVASQRMTATQYPRGNTVFGKGSKFMAQIADSNFVQTWNDGKQAYISEVDNGTRTPDLIYAPPFPPEYQAQANDVPNGTTLSIIGTPQQIQQGVIFTVLLDPRLKVGLPPLIAQLVRTALNFELRNPNPNSELPTALSANLTFFVGQVRHMGDSRGNTWYTEVTGWSTGYAQTLLNLYS